MKPEARAILVGFLVGIVSVPGMIALQPRKAEATPFYSAEIIKQYTVAQAKANLGTENCSSSLASCTVAALTSSGAVSGTSYTATAASGSSAFIGTQGAKWCLNGSGCTVYIHMSDANTVAFNMGGANDLTVSAATGSVRNPTTNPGFSSATASGSVAYAVETTGAYVDFGAGSFDRASSNGSIITFDSPISDAPGRQLGRYAMVLTTDTTFTAQGLPGALVTGTPSASLAPTGGTRKYIQYASGASNGNVAGIIGAYTSTRPLYRPKVNSVILTDTAITTRRVYVGVAESTPDQLALTVTTAATAIDYVALAFDTAISANWLCCSGDGTNHGCDSTGVAVAGNTEYALSVDWKVAGTLRCCVNGTCVNKTSNLSTQATSMGMQNTLTTLDNNARNHFISSMSIEQN